MPASVTDKTFDPATQELVILVHGTFANNPSKSQRRNQHWWQPGGDVWNRIDEQLPRQFHVASETKTEVFSWSGDNSERDRRAGGRELFRHLQNLEKVGARYHLIGHSHGGSVIWHCLLESVKQRLRRRRNQPDDRLSLPGLRSYTTVGTPFLQLRSLGIVSRLSPWFWLLVVLVATSVIVGLMIVKRGGHAALPWNKALEKLAPTASQWLSPALDDSLIAAGWGLVRAILDHPIAAAALGVVIACMIFFAMIMWAWSSAVQLEASVVRQGLRIRNQAFVEFGSRWLGIWSRHDEAINGLKASLRKFKGNIAPRIEVSGVTVFDFDHRMRFYRLFARWFVAPAFNFMVSRPSDRIIWKSISRVIQGNDRPGCFVSCVSPGPIVPQNSKWVQLAESDDQQLVDRSNKCLNEYLTEQSEKLLPKLRDMLSQLAWANPDQLSLLFSEEKALDGNVLVHTSYFHEPAIIELIACHILRHNHVKAPRGSLPKNTIRWVRKFRHKARDISREPSLQKAGLPLFGQGNTRAVVAFVLACLLIAGLVWHRAMFETVISFQSGSKLSHARLMEARYVGLWFGGSAALASWIASWTSVGRAKRGARFPRTALWAHRTSIVTLMLYAVAALVYGLMLIANALGGA